MDIITQKKIGIYVFKSPSGRYYVGKCVDFRKRMNEYKRLDCKGQKAIYNALKHYGFEAFEVIFMSYPREMLNWAEKWYVRQYKAFIEGYNCTEGGDGLSLGFKHSDETKKKMSKPGRKNNNWKGGANRLCKDCGLNKVYVSKKGLIVSRCKICNNKNNRKNREKKLLQIS